MVVYTKYRKLINMPGQDQTCHAREPQTAATFTNDCGLNQSRPTFDTNRHTQKDEMEEQEPKHGGAASTTNVFDLGLDLSPYIKEELKITIRRKRAEKGLEEINVDQSEILHYDLSEDELQKKQRRRERNKLAAAKLRNKKKLAENSMREEYERQSELNKKLIHDLEKIEQEKTLILESLNETQSKQLTENKTLLSVSCLDFKQNEESATDHRTLDELYKDSASCNDYV
ncbi:cyclic AMP-dependent transcription factor ATF-3-like [Anneissia japonica]|uniref:cyclic AMP-dependent transcription factor ATF-3-like n=1 Tax=Anneissia japonica TaxID=1529436 RepID=UPI001425B02A|nr:cyclic AMP-dependent transcription factor ATF-3-like [Anneissia japonica]